MYRRGMAKNDIYKDTINIQIENEMTIGAAPSKASAQGTVVSLSSLLSDLIEARKKVEGS